MNKLKAYIKRSLRVLMGALLVSSLLVTSACGGGGGGSDKEEVVKPPRSEPPAGTEHVRDYWMTFGTRFRGVLVAEANPAEPYSSFVATDGDISWGEDYWERIDLEICNDGKEYMVFRAFEHPNAGKKYPASNERTEFSVDGGPWVEAPRCSGMVYIPAEVRPYGSLEVRQWGWVHSGEEGTALYADKRPFYWHAHFTYGDYEYNPCFNRGAESRKVITQREAWWDDYSGWMRGRGSVVPWTPPTQGQPLAYNRQPVEVDIVHRPHRIAIAQGAGIGWTVDEPNKELTGTTRLCMRESEFVP
jgi:hypothetical protein